MSATEGHDHSHDHDHGHDHGHGHGDDFDWESMADRLERDATMVLPIVDAIVHDLQPALDWATVRHLLDLGCGPGIVSCALDSTVPLLSRVRHHAADAHLATRVHAVQADMETALPAMRPMDVVWAGMVLHHVAHPGEVLAALRHALQPGGTLVMIEFAGPSRVLPAHDPLVPAWDHLEAASAQARNARIGRDPTSVDWSSLLAAAGYVDIVDRVMVARHPAPLGAAPRSWIEQHVRSGIEFVEGQLSADDIAALHRLADEAHGRDDLFVRVERRVLTARTPGG